MYIFLQHDKVNMIININKSRTSKEHQYPEISLTNPIKEINNFIIIVTLSSFFFFAYNTNVISRECNMNLMAIICHSCILSRIICITMLFDPLKQINIII